ncbi:hypothetical protein GCM10009616_28760 [Microlunatus lacustris]
MPRTILPSGDHEVRAARHAKIGDLLAGAGDEWSAVCHFYSAYHLVRNRLVTDPIFDDLSKLKAVNANLVSDDRHTESHHGSRQPGMSWGVNELVKLLYPSVYAPYELLHQASIQVRYDRGLFIQLARVKPCLTRVSDAFDAGLAAA